MDAAESGTVEHNEPSLTPAGDGAATSGTATSGTATSGTATSGTATSGTATSGTATSGTATSGTATSGTATSGVPTSHAAEDARAADGPRPVEAERDRHRLRRVVRTTVFLLLLLGFVRIFVFEPYAIPTGSMRPTIIEGDVLLVNKLPYIIRSLRTVPFTHSPLPHLELPGLGELERGDVVVFDFPEESGHPVGVGEAFVKRIAALGGDTVRLIGGRVFVNGRELPPGADTRARSVPIDQRRADELIRYGGSVVVPFEGHVIALDSVAAARWAPLIHGEGSTVEYRNRIVFIDGLPATYYTFRRDYFFALGDNSGDSHDSRFFGFVPVDNLIGQATIVYWSRNPVDGIRWDRIGVGVR